MTDPPARTWICWRSTKPSASTRSAESSGLTFFADRDIEAGE
jgi:hypothetical protein